MLSPMKATSWLHDVFQRLKCLYLSQAELLRQVSELLLPQRRLIACLAKGKRELLNIGLRLSMWGVWQINCWALREIGQR